MEENMPLKNEVLTVEATTIEEVEQILLSMETYIIRIDFNDKILRFTKESRDDITYYVQRKENDIYGIVFCDGVWLHSYPHLSNIRDTTKFTLDECILEEKVNGTHIILGKYSLPNGNDLEVIRTRMNPFPTEFPVPAFWNSHIDGLIRRDIADRITAIRTEMLEKHPEWFIFAGEGEYVGLKVQEIVNSVIEVKAILDAYPDHNFHFELVGNINPIVVDSEFEFGRYDFDVGLILIDIFYKPDRAFVDRSTKEKMAKELLLELVPVRFNFTTVENMRHSIDGIKRMASDNKIEGFVIKNTAEIVKIKPDVILHSAYRVNSIMKGRIYNPDLLNYISKIVTMEYLSQPEDFDKLVQLIADEAREDYTGEMVQKNMIRIRKFLAHEMALLITINILKERKFASRDEMFRYLNTEIPKRFEPLKSYIDYNLEKTSTDVLLVKRMKRRRKDLMRKVTKYCLNNWEN